MVPSFLPVLLLGYAFDCITAQSIEQNSIRLVGGELELEGRVEVFRGNQWGTVCDDQWDDNDASVVCKQLGYSSHGAMGFMGAHFGKGTGPIYFDDVMCTGEEERLVDCPRSFNCLHDEDASVRCTEEAYFLFGNSKLRNNTFVTLSEIQQNNISLACFTENTTCCSKDYPQIAWVAPEGHLNNTMSVDFYAANQSLVLNTTELAVGIYQCIILNRENNTNLLFIGILNDNEGDLVIQELRYNKSAGTLYCISTGGPIAQTTWRKNGEELLKTDHNYQFSQHLVDSTQSTFSNSVRFVNKDTNDSGYYTCEVVNQNGNVSSILMVSTCKENSIRLMWNKEQQPIPQVCLTDEWHEIEVSNGIAFKKVNNLALNLQLIPSHDSIDLLIYNATASGDLVVKCSTQPESLYSMKREHSILLQSTQTDKPLAITINGLLKQTHYECCITETSNFNTSIPSISLKCGSVTTPNSPPVTATNNRTYISVISTLGSLLGTAVIVTLAILLIIFCQRIICKYRVSRESLECSVMRENPLYESADNMPGVQPEKSIYADIFPKKEDESEADTNSHHYADILILKDHVPKPSSESSAATNPLYITGSTI